MTDNIGKFYVLNNTAGPVSNLESIQIPELQVVYEVIRIIDKVPLFLEDHFARLKNSLDLLNIELRISEHDINGQIRKLIEHNGQENCNVKVVVYHKNNEQNYLFYISKCHYPDADEIRNGVRTALLRWERENPNIKLVNQNYKEKVSQKIDQERVFEVLLVNSDNNITEGSRSNVFFIKGKMAFTAPGDMVLKGITRQYIIDACRQAGVEVVETLTGVDSLEEIDALFISGTSIKVLPVSSVDHRKYDSGSNRTVTVIRDQFDKLLDEYIKFHRD